MPRGRNNNNQNNNPARPVNTKVDDKEEKELRATCPDFKPEDINQWCFDIEVFLRACKCFGAIDLKSNNWTSKNAVEKEEMNDKAFHWVKVSLGEKYKYWAQQFKPGEAKKLYDKLVSKYKLDNVESRIALSDKLSDLCWTTSDNVDSFFAKVSKLRIAHRDANIPLLDEDIYVRILKVLPKEFATEKGILRREKNIDLDDMQKTLLLKQEDLIREKKLQDSNPLSVSDSSAYPMNGNVNNWSKKRKNDSHKKIDGRPNKQRKVECFYCGKEGHVRPKCHTRIEDRKLNVIRKALPQAERDKNKGVYEKGHAQVMSSSNLVSTPFTGNVTSSNSSFKIIDDDDPDGWVCMLEYEGNYLDNSSITHLKDSSIKACLLVSNNGGIRSEVWIIDSGATHHITNNPNWLTNISSCDARIKTGNSSSPLSIDSKGEVSLRPVSDEFPSITLENVLYSPQASCNIISTLSFGKNEGVKVVQQGGFIRIVDENRNGKVILQGCERRPGDLIDLSSHVPVIHGDVNVADIAKSKEESLRLLHNRMGHLNSDDIKLMVREKMVEGVPESIASYEGKVDCPHCTAAKMTRKPYRSEGSNEEVEGKLEIGDETHSDTFGPINPVSRYKHSYIIIFLDKASRLCCVYGMNSLDETREKFILYKNLLYTQMKKKVKLFKCDGYGAYNSALFRQILEQDGTIFKMRAPDEPNQNPFAERWIRILVEIARTLMIHSNCSAIFWEDAIFHANWIKNRVTTRGLKGKVPYTMWWGKKPNLEHARPFGCLGYVLIHKERRVGNKFDAVAEPGVFLGFSDNHSAYKMYMLGSRKVKIARDVRFYEEIFPFRNNPSSDLSSMNPYEVPNEVKDRSDEFDPLGLSTSNPDVGKRVEHEIFSADQPNVKAEEKPQKGGVGGVQKRLLVHEIESWTPCCRTRPRIMMHAVPDDDDDETGLEIAVGWLLAMDSDDDSPSIKVVLNGAEKAKFMEATRIEYKAIYDKGCFKPLNDLARQLLKEKKIRVHGTRPVFTRKRDGLGNINRYKCRCVVKGFSMVKGVDFDKTFAPCAKLASVRMIISIAVHYGWMVIHADVPNAFLNGDVQKLVLVKLPVLWNQIMGDELGKDGDPVIMAKSVYGAPDASRNWNTSLHTFFIEQGYTQCIKEPCLYFKGVFPKIAIFGVWVDDNFVTGGDTDEIDRMMNALFVKFQIKSLGPLKFALGISFEWIKGGCRMTQTAYVKKIQKRFFMDGCTPSYVVTNKKNKPRQSDCPTSQTEVAEMKKIPFRAAIGSLLYLALATRVDICYIVCLLARYSHNPSKKHWDVVKDVIRYMVTTAEEGLVYTQRQEINENMLEVNGFSDASFNDCDTTSKSTCGYLTFFDRHCITWRSKLSKVVAQSAMEAEMIALSMLAKEVRWIKLVLEQIFARSFQNIPLYCDNDPTIDTYEGGYRVTDSTKHIKPKYFFIIEMLLGHEIKLLEVGTDDQLADIQTKILANPKFGNLRNLCGVY